MANPYSGLADYAFWKRSVSGRANVDPVVAAPFHLSETDAIATAGSCFAQHISRTLVKLGYHYLVTERAPETEARPENYGVFPARFGNIYTARQLLQTFKRAYGLFEPADSIWWRDGVVVDAFRPQILAKGFADKNVLRKDRAAHLACVRDMFETADVFIFTLGLTEAWVSLRDGAVYPVAPGVSGGTFQPEAYAFHNFTVEEVIADLREFVAKVRVVNPGLRLILTVSPVPLIATYEPRHVLVSTTYSKSVLRVAAQTLTDSTPGVAYFPSYEIITGPQTGGRFYEADLRNVTDQGVAYVMSLFQKHFLRNAPDAPLSAAQSSPAPARAPERQYAEFAEIVCDEEAIDP